jgi:hypothetical protein
MGIACTRKYCDAEIADIMLPTDLHVFSPPQYESDIWNVPLAGT